MSKNSIVYILTNEAMPDCVKIGITDDVERRMKELYASTAVPLPFGCFYAAKVNDATLVEKKLHFAFADTRVNDRREFFRILPERVRAVLELIAISDATPNAEAAFETAEEKHAVQAVKDRRPPFNFGMVRIKPGSILAFSEDPEITCEVSDAKKVILRGQVTSLSDAAKTVLHEKSFEGTSYQGTAYWEYEGETLAQRLDRLESGEGL